MKNNLYTKYDILVRYIMLDPTVEWTQNELSFAMNINRLHSGEHYDVKKQTAEEVLANYKKAFDKFNIHKSEYYTLLQEPTDMTSDQINKMLDKIDSYMRPIVELPIASLTKKDILFLCESVCLIWALFHEYYVPLIRLLAHIAVKFTNENIQDLHHNLLIVMKQMATDNYICGHDPALGCAISRDTICEGMTFANLGIGLAKTIIKRYRYKCSYSDATVTGLSVFILAKDVLHKSMGHEYNEELFDEYVKRNKLYEVDARTSRIIKDFRQVCYNDSCYNMEGELKYMQCSRCKIPKYCSKKCQLEHWREHKKDCK